MPDLAPGRIRIAIGSAGLGRHERSVTLAPGEQTDLSVELGPPREVSGRVVDPAGRPLPGARVDLDGVWALSDHEGRFRLSTSVYGTAVLVASLPGRASVRRALPRGGGPRDVELTLERGCQVEVTLASAAEDGRHAELSVFPASGGDDHPWDLRPAMTLRPGTSLVLEDLPPGRVFLRARHPVLRFRSPCVTLTPDTPASVLLTAERTAPE